MKLSDMVDISPLSCIVSKSIFYGIIVYILDVIGNNTCSTAFALAFAGNRHSYFF